MDFYSYPIGKCAMENKANQILGQLITIHRKTNGYNGKNFYRTILNSIKDYYTILIIHNYPNYILKQALNKFANRHKYAYKTIRLMKGWYPKFNI